MPVKFTVKYDKTVLTRIQAKIAGISKGDWISRALLESSMYMIRSTRAAVERKGIDIDGRRFEELSENYATRPIKSGGRGGIRHPILIRPAGARLGKFGAPGQMINSLGASDVKRDMFGGSSIVVKPMDATMQELGSFHQEPKAGSKMPRRAWLGIRDEDEKVINRIFKKHLNAMLEKK